MTVVDDLNTAAYRGITFFYRGSNESGGFKVAEHLYPGSDNFVVEQLGKVPRRFSMDCQVSIENRDRFDNALNTGGSGILTHPMYGNFVVKVTQYSKRDQINSLGLYDYSVDFVVELGLIVPSISSISTSIINNLRSKVITNASAFIKSRLDDLGVGLN